ncbi:hypothetical protein BDZ89DRAFT_1070850 [Hymenopellis radicata]|nr:hypothetical protein BDZ89DRAFT_1070850 [Hymenopellis radicata]
MVLEDKETYLRRLLDYKEAPLDSSDGLLTDARSPLHLFDRHIPDHLLLKRVTIVPSLTSDIANVTDVYYDDIAALPLGQLAWSWLRVKPKSSSAASIVEAREIGLGLYCSGIATRVLVNPDQPDKRSLMNWYTCKSLRAPGGFRGSFVVEDSVLSFIDIAEKKDTESPLEEVVRGHHPDLEKHCKYMITAQFFLSMWAVTVGRHGSDSGDAFPWSLDSQCSKKHIPDSPLEDNLWKLPISWDTIRPSILRRSDRLMEEGSIAWTRVPVPGNITPLPHMNRFKEGYTPVSQDYVQRAWANAVNLDCTFIIFDCGTAMRVGIRHRATQTLFLSELVDLVTSETPTFGKLFIGLHLAATHDALKRLPLLRNKSNKRSRETEQYHLPYKRRRTLENQEKAELKTQLHVQNSEVIAVYFRYGHDSPAPILLFSNPNDVPRPVYHPKDYVKLLLDERLGAGATGEALAAFIEPDASCKSPKYTDLVVKMATDPGRMRRLFHEFKIYTHLEAAGVQGIPRSLGFWTDTSRNVSALVLTNAGRPLGYLLDENKRVSLTPKQVTSLTQTLAGIHKAGVLHRDLRSWNILVDRFDRVIITDFDCSTLKGSEEEYRLETERLEKFTSGGFVDHDSIIGHDESAEDETSESDEESAENNGSKSSSSQSSHSDD